MERCGDDRVVISVIVRIAAVAKNFEVFFLFDRAPAHVQLLSYDFPIFHARIAVH